MPSVVVNEGGEFIMNKCELKGHKSHETIGVLVKKGDAMIKDSRIHNHILGGIHAWITNKNNLKIMTNKI